MRTASLASTWFLLAVGCAGSDRTLSDGGAGDGGQDAAVSLDAGDDAGHHDAGDSGDGHDEDASSADPIDLSELIETSGSHVVLWRYPNSADPDTELFALDLERNDEHRISVPDSGIAFIDISPDRETLFYRGADTSPGAPLFLARVLDRGVVPARAIDGPAFESGTLILSGWVEDQRFAVFNLQGDGMGSVHVVDTWSSDVHATLDRTPREFAGVTVSAHGGWLTYTFVDISFGIAHIVPSGIEELDIPDLSFPVRFSPFDESVIYSTQAAPEEEEHYWYRQLSGGEPEELDLGGHVEAFLDADHVLARAYLPELALRRATLSTSEIDELLFDAAVPRVSISNDGRSMLIEGGSPSPGPRFSLVDALGDFSMIPIDLTPQAGAFVSAFAIGRSHFYSTEERAKLTFIALGSGGDPVISPVDTEGETSFDCLLDPQQDERVVASVNLGEALALIDISQPEAERVATITPAHGGQLECAVWSPAGSSFVFRESVIAGSDSHWYVYRVSWSSPHAPGDAELIYDSAEEVGIVSYRP